MTPDHGRLAFLLPNMRGGGAERVALRLMEDAIEQGFRVDLLMMAAEGELMPLVPRQVRVIDLRASRIRNVVMPLVRYLRREAVVGIQISMWPLTVVGVLAHRIARSRARIVLSEHITLSQQYGHFDRLRRALLARSVRMAYPRADAVVVVSAQAADDLSTLSGIRRSMLEVIYNPIKPPATSATAGGPPVDDIWNGAVDRIVSAGSLKAQKNQALLIDAFALLRRRRPAHLVILGEGELRGELEAQVAAHGLTQDVSLPGFVLDPWPFYLSARLFALSSDYEGFGNVLVEAMLARLQVVSTDCPSGPREILDNGAYGRLVPCNDPAALAEAMIDALDRPLDPASLHQRAEALSGQEASDRYLRLMTRRFY